MAGRRPPHMRGDYDRAHRRHYFPSTRQGGSAPPDEKGTDEPSVELRSGVQDDRADLVGGRTQFPYQRLRTIDQRHDQDRRRPRSAAGDIALAVGEARRKSSGPDPAGGPPHAGGKEVTCSVAPGCFGQYIADEDVSRVAPPPAHAERCASTRRTPAERPPDDDRR